MAPKKKPEMLLWLSDRRGVYIPRDFAISFNDRARYVRGVSDETWSTLEQGPDAEGYWDAWQSVCDNATVTDNDGVEFMVYQEGDCWLVPKGMEWSDQDETWKWPETFSLQEGTVIKFKPASVNTGAMTINGRVMIRQEGEPLQPGELKVGEVVHVNIETGEVKKG